MSRPIILSADSTCDLGDALLEKYNVRPVPFNVTLGDEQYLDGITINPDRIYEIYRETKQLPRTAAINIATYEEFFRSFVDTGCDVIHISLGHGLSSSCQNAGLAADEVGNVWVIDSCNLSTGSGLLVIEAAKRIAAGLSAEQIAEELRALVPHCHASFVLDRLEFLHKGGRCSALAMMGANVLQLKPCIEVNNADGTMGVGKKYRGPLAKVREQYVRETLAAYDNIDYEKVFITHSGTADENVEALKKVVAECGPFENIYVTRAGCTISCHCGPETLGVLFMTK